MKILKAFAVELAHGAGAIVSKHHAKGAFTIGNKGAIDLVTTADKQSEAFVQKAVAKKFPTHALLGEEGGARGPEGAEYRWVCDPLDGTTNFAHGIPHFAVLIAVQQLVRGRYETLAGVTFDPTRDETYVAVKGQGATLDGRKIRVSGEKQLIRAVGSTGFGYDRLFRVDDNHAEYTRLNLVTQGIRRLGAAGLDFAWVACGRMELFWEWRLQPWDMAAGLLLVEEAGGRSTQLDGSEATVTSGSVLTSNGKVHQAALAALASARTQGAREGLETHLPKALHAKVAK